MTFLSNLPTLVLGTDSMKAQRSGSHHFITLVARYSRNSSALAVASNYAINASLRHALESDPFDADLINSLISRADRNQIGEGAADIDANPIGIHAAGSHATAGNGFRSRRKRARNVSEAAASITGGSPAATTP